MASTQLQRTAVTSTENYKYTFSAWVKRTGVLGSSSLNEVLFSNWSDNNNSAYIRFEDQNDNLHVFDKYGSTIDLNYQTNMKFRDPNAWYHIVVNVDGSRSANQRCKIYVNGSEVSCSNTTDTGGTLAMKTVTTTNAMRLGAIRTSSGAEYYFSGLMSHVHYIDGTGYDASYFGETDSTTGEWKIKTNVTGVTYGNNGFFVLKDGNSVTDQSPNTNNFTVGAGTLTKTEDNPSNVFATLLSEYPSDPTGGFANANTTAKSNADSTWRAAMSSIATPPNGKYYMELKWSSGTHLIQGCVSSTTIANNNFKDLTDSYTGNYLALYGANYYSNGSSQGTYGVQLTSGNIGMMAIDRDNNKFWWGVNGSWGTGHNPATNTGGISLPGDTDDFWHFAISTYSNSGAGAYEFNFGNGYFGTTAISSEGSNASSIGKFEYDVPNGFTALSTKGLNL
tara:strand:+ start:23 stop:1369 length:1347 start_codon:yes stop_codon:yes gene_type:complete